MNSLSAYRGPSEFERPSIRPGISYVARADADDATLAFYDKAEARFQDLLNVFKVFGHQPEYGRVFTETILAILQDGVLEWRVKELLILKTTLENRCRYCVVQHERVAAMLEVPAQKVADLAGDRYRRSPWFSPAEKVLLDFCTQISLDANSVPAALWRRLRRHWSEAQIVDATFVISIYTAVSRFVDSLGVELEEKFSGADTQLMPAD